MPSNTNPDMMLNLAADHPDPFENCETWQAVTGITVVPFSDACTPQKLKMPPKDYDGAKAAFIAYSLKKKVHKRRKFLAGKLEDESFHTDGCKSLKTWVHRNWTAWGLVQATKKVLADKHYEFYEFHKARRKAEVSEQYYV